MFSLDQLNTTCTRKLTGFQCEALLHSNAKLCCIFASKIKGNVACTSASTLCVTGREGYRLQLALIVSLIAFEAPTPCILCFF